MLVAQLNNTWLGSSRSRQCICGATPKLVIASSSSPWASPGKGSSDKGRGRSSSGSSNSSSSKNSSKSSAGKSKTTSGQGKKKTATKADKKPDRKETPSSTGKGFGPKTEAQPPVQRFKVTPPLTPTLLDALSAWESAAAPLWGTFTGHCEGEWLGQYSAYTPWGGDPEPVWADASGAYLTCAFCKASEERQSLPADTLHSYQQDSSSSSAAFNAEATQDEATASTSHAELFDVLVRSTQRSSSISSLMGAVSLPANASATADTSTTAEPAAAVATLDTTSAAEDEELEALTYNTTGSVVFNGGSYSKGPEVLQVPQLDEEAEAIYFSALEDAAAAAAGGQADGSSSASSDGDLEKPLDPLSALPFSVYVVEQALVASGDRRLRLVATLKVKQPPGEELDIEVARLVLYREFWYGPTPDSSSPSVKPPQLVPAHRFDVPVIDLPRPQPADLAGTWNVFVMAAQPAVEENANTLQDETVVLYSSREERQHWRVPSITSIASPQGSGGSSNSSRESADSSGRVDDWMESEEEAFEFGGSFWLPGEAVVTLRMVPSQAARHDSTKDAARPDGISGSDNHAHRGVMIGLHMLDGAGSCLFVEREYDSAGVLVEVRHGTAVKGGWSGGRM